MMDVDWACVKKVVMANGRIITRVLSTHGVKAVVPILMVMVGAMKTGKAAR